MASIVVSPSQRSPEQRRKRRIRRMRRTARQLGPYLALPVLSGLLALSVNLIEYRPTPEQKPTAASKVASNVPENAPRSVDDEREPEIALRADRAPMPSALPTVLGSDGSATDDVFPERPRMSNIPTEIR